MIKIGIIGGSGLDDPNLLQDYSEKEIQTKYGVPSSKITCGKISGIDVCILARHGEKHEIPPSQINFRANIAALKILGCTHIIATSAVGSLKEQIHPGDIIFPDQFIDFTKQRISTFYNEIGNVVHTSLAEPFSQDLRNLLIKSAEELLINYHKRATIIVIEGPRFSTKAESLFFRNFADIIGMTTVPEACLAKEVEIEYAPIALSTDYDCWKDDEAPVTFEIVLETMKKNSDKAKQIILKTIQKIALNELNNKDTELIKNSIRTVPNWPKQGIMFRDITTLLKNPQALSKTIEIFYNRYKDKNIEVVAGIESRGFIFGSLLAGKLNASFVPIRKPGKLPAETISQEYSLEYGTDKIEIHKDAIQQGQNILIIDDLLATGGTAKASAKLIEKVGGKVTGFAFIIELTELNGMKGINQYNCKSLVKY